MGQAEVMMPYLIDGHNLIGKLSRIRLSDMDDELSLVERLRAFCQARGRKAEVFFDQAAPGRAGSRSFGPVTARFVARGRSADEAIDLRLKQLGGAARNWTVVSSDFQVQASARSAHARVASSEDFANILENTPGQPPPVDDPGTADLDAWMDLFGGKE